MTEKLNRKNLRHALHNENVANYLDKKETNFRDWVITTSFYSALHYVRYKIFPLTIKSKDGGEQIFNNLEDYCLHKNIFRGKHKVINDLVDKHISPSVADDYKRLLDLSLIARYEQNKFTPKEKELARKILRTIKNECTKS